MTTRRSVTFDGVDYAIGARFEVVRDGLWIDGMIAGAWPNSHQMWRQSLEVGDVLTCLGYGPGFGSDPGYGVEFDTEKSRAAGAYNCDVHPPIGGIFAYRPSPGALRPLPAETGDGDD